MAADMHTFVNVLKSSLPQCLKSDDDASQVVTIVGSVITNAMKNQDTVYLDGIGEWRCEGKEGKKSVVFTPDRRLIDAANE